MKLILEGIYHLFLFKDTYTLMPRWMEIAYGVVAWVAVAITAWGIYEVID